MFTTVSIDNLIPADRQRVLGVLTATIYTAAVSVMLWRAQKIPRRSLHWNILLSQPPAAFAHLPLSRPPCSRTFVWTLPKRQDADVARYALNSSPARRSRDDDSETVPTSPEFFYHSQLQTTGVPPGGISENEIKVAGLIQSLRKQKKATFAQVSDGSTLEPLQAVLSPEQATGITNGAYVLLVGVWQKSLGKGQSHELHVRRVEAIGPSDPEQNPIQKKYQSQDYLRTLPHLRIRVPFHSLVARARSTLASILTQQFAENGAVQVHPPIITSSDCEGAGEVFAVSPQTAPSSAAAGKEPSQYFREPKYLTVSSQLHLEAYSAELGDVFALSPTFRAEQSDTPRHLSEFYMLEVEYRRIGDMDQLCMLVERQLRSTVRSFRESRAGRELLQHYAGHKSPGADDTIVDLENRWRKLEAGRLGYRHIWHRSAVRKLLEADAAYSGSLFRIKPTYTTGLQLEHERWIVENLGAGAPVFVSHYPKSVKPFYMLPSTAQMAPLRNYSEPGVETVACFDLLLPFNYGEVAGGSLREHRLETLLSTMRERGMLKQSDPSKSNQSKAFQPYPFLRPGEDLGNLKWYADLRRFGTSPHGGFGLGFDRLLAYLVGVSNVRDVVAFPRTWKRAEC